MQKITKENFITDDKTDRFYFSSLLDTVSGDLDRDARKELKKILPKLAPCEQLYNTMDVWARDYMPIQITKDIVLSYTYKPDYLKDAPECITNWQLHHVHTKKQLIKDGRFDFKVVQMPLILDGGNVIKAIVNDKPCMIFCDKILQENNINEEDFDLWWKEWWAENFDGTEMRYVMLPWEGRDLNPIGHADGIVRYIDEGRVLLTNYLDFDELYQDYHGGLCKEKLEEAGFDVTVLSYLNKFPYAKDKLFRLLFNHSWSYINYLQVGNRIFVPRLGYEELDNEVLEQIDKAFNANGHTVDVELIDMDMTPIIAGDGINNSGGALNCLTWTIKS